MTNCSEVVTCSKPCAKSRFASLFSEEFEFLICRSFSCSRAVAHRRDAFRCFVGQLLARMTRMAVFKRVEVFIATFMVRPSFARSRPPGTLVAFLGLLCWAYLALFFCQHLD